MYQASKMMTWVGLGSRKETGKKARANRKWTCTGGVFFLVGCDGVLYWIRILVRFGSGTLLLRSFWGPARVSVPIPYLFLDDQFLFFFKPRAVRL